MNSRGIFRVLSRVAALLLLVAGLVAFWPSGGGPVMPPANGTPIPGRFQVQERGDFDTSAPAAYSYQPSARIASVARQHVSLNGPIPRIWYAFTPSAEGRRPLVILLHGANRNGLSMIEMWEEAARRHGLALLAPDARGKTWPLTTPEAAFLANLVAEMAARHDIDPERIFLFGHSDGAAYAQVLLNRTKGPWRAAALHAGFASPAIMRPPAEALPLRLYLGDQDHIFDVPGARDSLSAMAAMGHDSDLVVIPGHSHWFYEIGPQIAEDSWRWFAGFR